MGRFNVLPEYSETADKFKTTDPGHADVFNDRMQILLNNDKYIKEKAEKCAIGPGLEFSVADGILNVTYDDGEEEA
ncbi:MAG: hypothetical protein HFH73_07730 [Lachnospiraceae bacterium]|jgi:hypothetical protein|nr:hypothetical protein [Lachnospiraceae bacterium]